MSDYINQRIVELREKRYTFKKIGEILRMNAKTVQKRYQRAINPVQPKTHTKKLPPDYERIITHYLKTGETEPNIVAALNTPLSHVRRSINHYCNTRQNAITQVQV